MGVSNGKAVLNVVEIKPESEVVDSNEGLAWYVYVIPSVFILGLVLFLTLRGKKNRSWSDEV
jgi:hypothetical protein